MLILLGVPIGFILRAAKENADILLTSDLFFYYLLPPIILDAGYFMPSRVFYLNIGTILLYAVLGTMFNTFAVGVSLYATRNVCNMDISLLQALLFGSLISAVDPVAVLAVFEEVHVHEVLYMLVFGESVLNDAASVVLYRTFESLEQSSVDAKQIGLAIASFFVVSIGGTIIGIVFALVTSFITKYTEHVRVIEPVFVFLMAYMSYLSAEIFHFSGIMSILFCGIVMKPYVESNVSRKSHTTIKYFLKLLSSSCEAIIFMFLGASLVFGSHKFNLGFVCFTLVFITIYRAIGVTILTGIANRCGRLTKVKKVEQFIMSYGGLRGAVAFCLAVLIKSTNSVFRNVVFTTTVIVVIFTVFVQGTTIKKLVKLLGVKRTQKREKSMAETLNDRMLGYMVAGVEEIIGVHGHGFWANMLEVINKKYLRRWLERDPDLFLDEEIVYAERRMAFKHALTYAANPTMMLARENDEAELSALKRNPSIALQLALRSQELKGTECGMIDYNILKDQGECSSNVCSKAFNERTISNLIPKAKKMVRRTYSQRKYTLDSLGERDAIEDHYLQLKRNSLVQRPTRSRNHKGHHHHKRKHKRQKDNNSGMSSVTQETDQQDTVVRKARVIQSSDQNSETESDDEGIQLKTKMPTEVTPLVTNPLVSQSYNKQKTEEDKANSIDESLSRDDMVINIIDPWADNLSPPRKSQMNADMSDRYKDSNYTHETGL
ncbi:sodium/hydrogen exchanger 2-like isoform X2 [Hydractinia symbiolongicarpus]|nr:sodium/hydrogen exchanger 2-like isoform X2 [Hydractinia symbiolongicarpus]XP_057317481.1 sodium/hydrogen exchanger 2-like isoform X2 [Hydractinia symbiolongicarpus]